MSNTKRYFFEIEDDKKIYAGGVLIYRKIYNSETIIDIEFLMIRNRNRYEDFGGRVDKDDKDIYDTVAREVYEESNSIISKKSVLKRIKKITPVYVEYSKYVLFIIEATDKEKDFLPEIFGNREYHDDIERTVEWISLNDFYSYANRKEINYRLINRGVFDNLTNLKNKYNLSKKSQIYLF
jgi:8-oxo-dGTP pyrophosphatase MutT (NUDIX family)